MQRLVFEKLKNQAFEPDFGHHIRVVAYFVALHFLQLGLQDIFDQVVQQLLVFHPRGVVVLVSVLRTQALCGQAFVDKTCAHHGFWQIHGFQAFGDVLALHEVAHLPKLASRNAKYF